MCSGVRTVRVGVVGTVVNEGCVATASLPVFRLDRRSCGETAGAFVVGVWVWAVAMGVVVVLVTAELGTLVTVAADGVIGIGSVNA